MGRWDENENSFLVFVIFPSSKTSYSLVKWIWSNSNMAMLLMATVAATEAAEAVAAEQALDSTSRRLRWMNWGATGTHCGSKWLKPAKNKFTYLKWFHEFFYPSFSRLTWFLFPVITCASYWKFVKLLQA